MRAVEFVMERFPDYAGLARRLYLRSEHFRFSCEEFAMSLESLRHFEARKDAGERPEIAEYRSLLREIEDELLALLEAEARLPDDNGSQGKLD